MEEDDAALLESLTEYYSPLGPTTDAGAGDECLPDSLPELLPSSRSRDKQHEPEGIIKAPKIVLTKIKTNNSGSNTGSLYFIYLSYTAYIHLSFIY